MVLNGNNTTYTYCVNESELYLAPVLRWLIPILILAGIFGNAMILIVLNSSKSMKTKPHLLLSAMAAADLAHTVLAFIINLYVYEDFINSDLFSRMYHHILKTPILVLVNWMSMTSTWLAVAVTVERLIAIRYPLKARFVMRKRFIVAAIMVIFSMSFVITSYSLFWLRPIEYISCQDPSRKLYRLYSDTSLRYYGHISRNLHSFLCSLVPVILLFIFNGSLVYHLHRNQGLMRKFYDIEHRQDPNQIEISDWSSNANGNVNNNGTQSDSINQSIQANYGAIIRREYKVAIVVLVISLTSACCLLPSAAIVVFDTRRLLVKNHSTPWWYFPAVDINNLLILSEKVLDFFLYCLTSGYFRRRLITVITARRRSSNIQTRRSLARAARGKRKRRFFRSRITSGNETAMDRTRHPSTSTLSTLSTFISSTTSRLRRSTASSDSSLKSPRLYSSRRFLTVQTADGHSGQMDGNNTPAVL